MSGQTQEAILVIKGDEINQLDKLIAEIPTKYGLPIVNLLQGVANKRYQEAQAEQAAKTPSTLTAVTKETENAEIVEG